MDYIHYNPVKHDWVSRPVDWPYSTLHGYIERGRVTPDWGEWMMGPAVKANAEMLGFLSFSPTYRAESA